MSAHDRLDERLRQVSHGRLCFDSRHRRLLVSREPGVVDHVLEMTETELRGLLQRLLLAAPQQAADGETLEVAVRLLLQDLDSRL